MTIREIEERSGISRANIRFYEAERLLHPRRRENGYRDYSDEDMLALQRIKLLRSLGISLEMIREISEGRISLYRVLGEQIRVLDGMREDAVRAENVCRKMLQDMVTFDGLQPEKYEKMQEEKETVPQIYQEAADVEPYVGPWRRYFARMLDLALIRIAGVTICSVCLHINIVNFSIWAIIVWEISEAVVMMLLEPIILHFFGTTPGKWILGLYLEEEDGRKPSVSNAGCWTRGAVVRGMGLGIPILSLILLIMSCLRSYRGEELSWEYLVYRQKRKKGGMAPRGRWVLRYICASALLVLIFVLNYNYVLMPPNRGALTVAEIAENYNRLHRVYGMDDAIYMTDSGQYEQRRAYADGVFEVNMDGQWQYEISYDLDGDQVRGITVTETGNGVFATQLYSDRMFLLMMSFAGADRDMGIFYNRNELAERLERGIIDGQSRIRLGNTDFSCEVILNNMEKSGTMLFVKGDEKDSDCTIIYSMQKIK